jgi:2-polyprenyl-3-methyl-5-hydroxy-6-metoxy-1,4-benzoquinol methylase
MEKKCFICEKSNIDFLLRKDGYNLWHCEKCKLNFIYPQPTEKELQKIYSLEGGYSHSNKGFEKKKKSSINDHRIDFLVKNNKKKVLDVGCASGSFVYSAKLAKLIPTGIDMDKDSIKFGIKEGLDLRHGKLHDIKFKNGEFDAIILGNIFEHVNDPKNFLYECLRILKKNGTLIISTPNTNSYFPKVTKWVYEKFGIMWSHSTPPYHLFDFSDKNLTTLLKNNNLKINKIFYSQMSLKYSIYHTGYFNELRKNMNGISEKDILSGLTKSFNVKILKQVVISFIYGSIFIINKLLDGKGDRMVIYCTKK